MAGNGDGQHIGCARARYGPNGLRRAEISRHLAVAARLPCGYTAQRPPNLLLKRGPADVEVDRALGHVLVDEGDDLIDFVLKRRLISLQFNGRECLAELVT